MLLVKFNAGLANFQNKRIVPDPKKGEVELEELSTGKYVFKWINRDTKNVERSQPIEGGKAELVKVSSGSDRIYWVKFTDKKIPKLFFWMQDASTERDSSIENTIKTAFKTEIPKTPVIQQPSSQPRTGGVQLSDLQNILNSLPNQVQAQSQPRMTRGPSLTEVLNPSVLEEVIINMPDSAENAFKEFLPEGHNTKQDMINLVHSPQFQQALNRFDSVLHSEDLPSIFYQCELQWNTNDLQGSIISVFFRAIQNKVNKERANNN